jgi:hypothetical protein
LWLLGVTSKCWLWWLDGTTKWACLSRSRAKSSKSRLLTKNWQTYEGRKLVIR